MGHCINNPQIVWMSATFGRLSTAGDATFRSIKADSWTTHPNLNTTLKKDDIGVVRLSEKVAIAPIRLSFANGFPRQGLNVTVMGYGETDTERRRAKNLNQVQLSVRNWDDCYRLYGEDDGPVKICAGGNGKVRKQFVSMSGACVTYWFELMLAILRMRAWAILEAP